MDEARFTEFPSAVSSRWVFVLINLRHECAGMRWAVNWCCHEFGDPTPERWEVITDMIRFSDPNDAMAFKLRWC